MRGTAGWKYNSGRWRFMLKQSVSADVLLHGLDVSGGHIVTDLIWQPTCRDVMRQVIAPEHHIR